MKKMFKVVGISLLSVGILAGCGKPEITVSEGVTVTTGKDAIAAKKAAEAEAVNDLNFGETLEVDGVNLTLNSAKKENSTTLNNDYFVVLDFTVENTTDKDVTISSIFLTLSDEEGNKFPYSFTGLGEDRLNVPIAPGATITGKIKYDAKDSDRFIAEYSVPGASNSGIWTFGKSK